MPEAQTAGQFVTQIMPGVVQSIQGQLLFPFIAADSHPDVGMPAVGADLHFGYFDGQQPRVSRFESDDFGEFFADRFGDP